MKDIGLRTLSYEALDSHAESKKIPDQLFDDRLRYHKETSSLICRAKQWTGFYMITASIMKELNRKRECRAYIFSKRTTSYEPSTPTSSSHENSFWSKTVTKYLDELLCISDNLLNEGIYWVLIVVEWNFCYRSCAGISSLFKVTLGEHDEIAQKFFCDRAKSALAIRTKIRQQVFAVDICQFESISTAKI